MILPISFLLLALTVAASPRDLAGDAEKYLLPGNIVPLHYDVEVLANIQNFNLANEKTFYYNGSVNIDIVALEDVTEVIIHTYEIADLDGFVVSLNDSEGIHLQIGNYDEETNMQTLVVSPALKKDQYYKLTLVFSGINNADLTGFYRASYFENLTRRWLLVTDFESFGARRAFPCFDEPKYKATFQLNTLVSQSLTNDGYVSHFNTEIESVTTLLDYTLTKFKTTPLPLSTYLVAFLISNFKSSPEPTYFNSSYAGEEARKPFRTVGRPRYANNRQDLLSQVAGPAVLEYMTRKTGVGFGFTKVDQAGIPEFSAGAMENWGLVTYREGLLFWDENDGTTGAKQSVVTVIAHELGHQWFGDLVTLHWWSDLWLNEGFATFYEFHAADQIREPTLDTSSWDLIGQFVVSVIQATAFPADSVSDARPLTSEAYDRPTIDGFFDSISYEKGGSVLRMLRHILGEDIFYAGLNKYLTANAESTGTPESLLENLNTAAEQLPTKLPIPVTELFKGWHLQPGYPVITVTRNNSQLTLTQERYSWDNSENLKWNVPISYSTNLENNFNDTRPTSFLLESADSLVIELEKPSASWVVINNQATGYYRINYDEANWDALIDELENQTTTSIIHDYNRAQIYDDLDNLSGFLKNNPPNYGKLLRLLRALKYERSYVVWQSGLNIMNFLRSQLSSHPETYSLLKEYLSEIVAPVFQELSLKIDNNEPHTKKLLRVAVAEMACQLGIDSCRKQAQEEYKKSKIPSDIRQLVLCEVIRNGNDKFWETTLEKALGTESPLRNHLLSALVCSTANLDRLLNILEHDNRLSPNDKQNIIFSASQVKDKNQAMLALKILSKQKKFRKTQITSKLLTSLARSLNSEEAAQLMKPISTTHSKIIELNRVWLEKKQPEILNWLQSQSRN